MKNIRDTINLVENAQRHFPEPSKISDREEQNGQVTMTIGRIYRRAVRNALDDCASYGITYSENKNMLDSDFVIRGKIKYLKAIAAKIEDSFGMV